jgi:hypothetical protein
MRKEPTSLIDEVLYSIDCELPKCVFVGSRFGSRCTSLYRLDTRYRVYDKPGNRLVPKSREVYIIVVFADNVVHELAYLVSNGGCWITIDMSADIDNILGRCDWSEDGDLDRLYDYLADYCASMFEGVWSSTKYLALVKLDKKPIHEHCERVMLKRNYCCRMSHRPMFHDASGLFHTCVTIRY